MMAINVGVRCSKTYARYVNRTGTRSKIFNEIVLKDNHFLTLHEKCI